MNEFELKMLQKMDQVLDRLTSMESLLARQGQTELLVTSTQTPEETIKAFAEKWEKAREAESTTSVSIENVDVMEKLKEAGSKLGMLQDLLNQFSQSKQGRAEDVT